MDETLKVIKARVEQEVKDNPLLTSIFPEENEVFEEIFNTLYEDMDIKYNRFDLERELFKEAYKKLTGDVEDLEYKCLLSIKYIEWYNNKIAKRNLEIDTYYI